MDLAVGSVSVVRWLMKGFCYIEDILDFVLLWII
jgi:hypothetical protein